MLVRHIPILVIVLLVSGISQGQELPHNQYANERWLGDSIVGLPSTPDIGFRYRPVQQFPPDRQLSLPTTPADSNTYSRLIYRITNVRNQTLSARIHRPLSLNEALDISIERTSNEGWAPSSQARYTRAHVSLEKEFMEDRLRVEVEGKALIFDRDQNGGLRGDDYSFSGSTGQFGELNNDIYITSAFNRSTDYWAELRTSYDLTKKLEVGIKGRLRRERFLFDDNSGDKGFYDSLRVDTLVTAVRDSNWVSRWSVGAFGRYILKSDSAVLSWLEVEYDQVAIRYKSLAPSEFTTNSIATLRFHRHRSKGRWMMSGQSVIAGYNQGDLRLRSTYDRLLSFHQDSSGTSRGLDALLKVNAQRYEPAAIFESYASNFISFFNDLSKVSAFDLQLGLKGYNGGLFYGATLEGQARENFVFLNEELAVSQTQDVIGIVGIDVRGGVRAKGFDVSIRGRYQSNVFDDVYDVPDFIGVMDASFTFPMFKKSIYLRTGFDGWYFSDYRARGYLPMHDLYFLRTERKYGNYIQLNPYAMATIQSVDVKFRVLNANYGFLTDEPLVGPGYASVPRYFEFRVDWTFKN